MEIDDTAAAIELPMERPLYSPAYKPAITRVTLEAGNDEADAAALFSQFVIDKAALARHIRQSLQQRTQVTLRELLQSRPLGQGLAELVAYLQLASERANTVVDESVSETVAWQVSGGQHKQARLPRVIFLR